MYKSINNETFDEGLQTKILYKHTIQAVRQLVGWMFSAISAQTSLDVQAEQVGGSTRYVHVPIMFASWLSSLLSLQVVRKILRFIGELGDSYFRLLKVISGLEILGIFVFIENNHN